MRVEDFFPPPSPEQIKREKQKARELRKSQWWKNRRSSTNTCYYCGIHTPARELTMDHVVPLARGGQSVKSNLVPCCKSCNTQKKNLLPLEWKEYLTRLRSS